MNWFKKHKILTVILAIIVIAVISSAAGDNKSQTNTSNNTGNNDTTAKSDTKKSTTAKIGEAANDGKFEFTVKGLTCGKATVGTNQYLTRTAQGQYCLLAVTVKNIGDEKQSLLSSNQLLFDAAGKKYSADDTATIYAAPEGSSWYSDINPGNSVEGTIVFDVPKGVTPNVAELHDSAFSGGVKVTLQ